MERYKISVFARMVGVTVRTLQHYDRIGLLSPAQRTESGYRLYGQEELVRIQQIRTLRWMGLALNQIKQVLLAPSYNLLEMLRHQHRMVQAKATALAQASEALERMIMAVEKKEEASIDSETIAAIIKGVEKEQGREWSKKYFSEEQWEEFKTEAARVPAEELNTINGSFAKLKESYAKYGEAAYNSEEVQSVIDEMQQIAARMKNATSINMENLRASLKNIELNREAMPAPMRLEDSFSTFLQKAYMYYGESHNNPKNDL